jgi:uncharacterized membrane protein
MQLSGELFSSEFIGVSTAIAGAVYITALRFAPWRKLLDRGNSNVFFGALVSMLLLWVLRTEMEQGLVFHLSAMTALTLMFGWSMAIIGGSIVLAGVTLFGLGDWGGFFPSLIVEVILPASLTWLSLLLVRALLPKNFFIYVFINAFFTGGAAAVLSALVTALLLVYGSSYSWETLSHSYLPYFPLMFFPEAVLNGWIMTILVGLKPEWVFSFRDEEYLHGK